MKVIKIIGGLFVGLVVLAFIFSPADNPVVEHQMQQIENQVADDAVQQYNIAKRNGNAIDIYSAASYVCAAYLQANDEANYAKWKKIEKQAAINAGMPITE